MANVILNEAKDLNRPLTKFIATIANCSYPILITEN